MVGAELQLEAILGAIEGHGHDAGVGDEHIDARETTTEVGGAGPHTVE